jgi:hypothetical protein
VNRYEAKLHSKDNSNNEKLAQVGAWTVKLQDLAEKRKGASILADEILKDRSNGVVILAVHADHPALKEIESAITAKLRKNLDTEILKTLTAQKVCLDPNRFRKELDETVKSTVESVNSKYRELVLAQKYGLNALIPFSVSRLTAQRYYSKRNPPRADQSLSLYQLNEAFLKDTEDYVRSVQRLVLDACNRPAGQGIPPSQGHAVAP